MRKPNNIRKRALDYARKRQWDKAIIEFNRLIEVERHNPNLFNEIGDLHLKVANRREAFKSFHEAIDAYSGVGLNNNAVAVCKKILRLNPQDPAVCGKLAMLRHRQGFRHEAVAYSVTFLDNLLESADVPAENLRELVVEVSTEAGDESEVLEKVAEYLLKCQFNDDAGVVLDKLDGLYSTREDMEKRDLVRKRMESIGHGPAPAPDVSASLSAGKLETVESHRDHSGGGKTEFEDDFGGSVPPHARRSGDQNVGQDFGVIDIQKPANDGQDAPKQVKGPGESEGPVVLPQMAEVENLDSDLPSPTQTSTQTTDESGRNESSGPANEYVIPAEDAQGGLDGILAGCEADVVRSAEIVGEYASEVMADVDEDDYRSHYDLGVAYLEMGLFSEAVREFQFASNSSSYQVRSLEMIGQCFIEQNQPELAIKQLTRGLSRVGGDGRDTLGIKYNLGLAYEMIGEMEKAQSCFEDVYVIDVAFRDVEEKINKYAS